MQTKVVNKPVSQGGLFDDAKAYVQGEVMSEFLFIWAGFMVANYVRDANPLSNVLTSKPFRDSVYDTVQYEILKFIDRRY